MGNACTSGAGGVASLPPAPPDTTHSFHVKTGDRKGASADYNIFMSICDDKGKWSDEQSLDTKWKDDFEAGHLDSFHLKLPEVGRPVELKIRRDETGGNDMWYLEFVIVAPNSDTPRAMFPVNRWVGASDTLCLSEFDSSLPQDDKHSEQRAKELEKKRGVYCLKQYIDGAPHQVENMPIDESFTNDVKWDIQAMKMKLFAKTKYVDLTTPRITNLADYKKLFKGSLFPVPYGEKNWKSDEEFGNQRLAGCNPTSLKLCQVISEHCAIDAGMVEPFLEGKTLSTCFEEKKIYVVDLSYLADIECVDERKLPGPTALFYSKDNGNLVPIAIQLMPEPAEDNPVFLPSDPQYTWLTAKMWFNLADASHHQSVVHLGFTHLLMETVAVCTHRQLSPSHPIYRLLAPHFLYLIAINTLAIAKLTSPGGWIDEVMHAGSSGVFNIMKHNWAEWNMKDHGNLLTDLKIRGVDDSTALPNYHYRDDAILLWDAISKYVSTVVDQVYDTEDKLKGDTEIQAWASELAGTDIKEMPASLSTNSELSEVLTTFIFTSSAGHAAANFCQYDEYAFAPNYPAKLIGEPPKDKTALTEKDIVVSLPPKEEMLSAMIVTKLLSERGTNELGNFEIKYGYDPIATKALDELTEELTKVSASIDENNGKRERKYPYLNPREVPNAISI